MQLIQTPRILVLEGDPFTASAIGAVLNSRRFRCVLFPSGAQAMRVSMKDEVDLIIADLTTIGAGERAIVETISCKQQVSVILITSTDFFPQLNLQRKPVVLQKPFDSTTLLDAIEEALEDSGGNMTPIYRFESMH